MAISVESKNEIRRLVDKYALLARTGSIAKFNEEMTKKDFILPLFRTLGWNVEDSSEVSAEERISKKRVDYGFRIGGITRFFLEAKSLKEDLGNAEFVEQAIKYAYNRGVTWAVLTNFREMRLFNAEWLPDRKNILSNQFISLRAEEFLQDDSFELLSLLSRESILSGELDKRAERIGKKARRQPIDEQLLGDFTRWRQLLSKNIVKYNKSKKLTEEELDETVQRILNRLIFMRKCEDNGLEDSLLKSALHEWEEKREKGLYHYVQMIFRQMGTHYDSELFGKHLCDDVIVTNDVFKEIITGLYETKDKLVSYDFSAIDADILGSVYEQYLGHILRKSASRAKVTESHVHRKEQGVYYTPIHIVNYIVEKTLGELLKEKRDLQSIRVLDAACGSGSFLIKAFDVLNDYYMRSVEEYRQNKLDSVGSYSSKVGILKNSIFGVDLDTQAVEISQLNLLLKIAEKGQRLPLLRQNIKCGNSLIDDPRIAGDKAFAWEAEFPEIMKEGGFDVVIGNPPYVRLQTLNKDQMGYFHSRYKSATLHYDIFTLFAEKGLAILKKDGKLGFILPSKFFTADYGVGLRRIISENKCLCQVVNFRDYQIFDEATTYTCLLFLSKSRNETFEYYEVSDKLKLQQSRVLSSDVLSRVVLQHPKDDSPWNFSSDESGVFMQKLDRAKLKLKDISKDIFQGFLTGRDRFFFVKVVKENDDYVAIRNGHDEETHEIEKPLLRKLLMGRELKRWVPDWGDLFAIYPYETVDGGMRLIPPQEMKLKYPRALQYFLRYKKDLMSSETSEAVDESNWYRFRRPRSSAQFEQAKIMTQVLSTKNSFSFDENGEYYFVGGGNAGGFGVILDRQYASDYLLILSILNSKLLEFYLKKISTPFRGGFYSYGKKFIEKLPIIMPSGVESERLKELSKEQMIRARRLREISDKRTDERTKIEEIMSRGDREIDEIIYKIYGTSDDERKLVERSLE